MFASSIATYFARDGHRSFRSSDRNPVPVPPRLSRLTRVPACCQAAVTRLSDWQAAINSWHNCRGFQDALKSLGGRFNSCQTETNRPATAVLRLVVSRWLLESR